MTHTESGMLIVFTDAKDSTEIDERLLQEAMAEGGNIPEALTKMLALRNRLFTAQILRLPCEHEWEIVKNVGDALVLTARVPDSCEQASSRIEACLKDLTSAWSDLETNRVPIRIAVHYVRHSHIAKGKDLRKTLKQLRDVSALGSLNGFLSALTFDIFGPGINRAARLAYAPSGPLFVVSQQTVNALLKKSESDPLSPEDLRKCYMGQLILAPVRLRGPIPLIKIKGVDNVGFCHLRKPNSSYQSEPWWIWEVPASANTKVQTFGGENKRFQVLRIIHAAFRDKKSIAARLTGNSGADLPDEPFEDLLRTSLPFMFFVDLALKIVDVWSFYAPSDNRDFDRSGLNGPQWKKLGSEISSFLPYYAVLTSCPNEATDAIIRRALRDVPSLPKAEVRLEPLSYQVHSGVRIPEPEGIDVATGPEKRLYLVMFQVSLNVLRDAASASDLFKDCPDVVRGEEHNWHVCMKGVVRGDKDGFLLLSLDNAFNEANKADADLQNYLCRNTQSSEGTFFSRIAPIKVYVGNSLRAIAKENVRWLQECIRDADPQQ